jgi:Excalibur calcium-binding domain
MQRITKLWGSGSSGKLIILGSSLFGCCLASVCVGLILPRSSVKTTPTMNANAVQTYIVETMNAVAALNSPTITSTLTSAPTFTAFPSFTALVLSSDTPAPTATVVFVLPTSASSGFDNNGDGKVTCADFSTQAEAQQAYNAGYTQLDGNDNDGRACESLP